jgi:biopolymer transport protein TolQ
MPILTAALLFILQADSGAAPQPAGALTPGPSALTEMFSNIGPVAMACCAAAAHRQPLLLDSHPGQDLLSSSKATKESRRFIRAFRKATRLQEIAQLASDCKASPLAQVFEDVYETYKRQTGGSGPPRNLDPAGALRADRCQRSRHLLERRMTWLATIASTSPFVGLFGTVMGIIDAFHGLGTAGAATLRAVAPGISEALITTAAGLFVAVPAVVAYNQFTARIRVFASASTTFAASC